MEKPNEIIASSEKTLLPREILESVKEHRNYLMHSGASPDKVSEWNEILREMSSPDFKMVTLDEEYARSL